MSIIMMIIIIIIINVTETKWLKAEVCMKNKGYLQRRCTSRSDDSDTHDRTANVTRVMARQKMEIEHPT